MFFSPQKALEEGWLVLPESITDVDTYLQPNAVDFTLDKVFTIKPNTFVLSEKFKVHRGTVPLVPVQWAFPDAPGVDDYFFLNGRTTYDAVSDFYVNLPKGVAALVIIRSTLNRNGLFVTSGLYDSGYQGNIGFALHNNSEAKAVLQKGVRVGQIIFGESDALKEYAGQYNHKNGTHWAETTEQVSHAVMDLDTDPPVPEADVPANTEIPTSVEETKPVKKTTKNAAKTDA